MTLDHFVISRRKVGPCGRFPRPRGRWPPSGPPQPPPRTIRTPSVPLDRLSVQWRTATIVSGSEGPKSEQFIRKEVTNSDRHEIRTPDFPDAGKRDIGGDRQSLIRDRSKMRQCTMIGDILA
jgi:hypothetical protein